MEPQPGKEAEPQPAQEASTTRLDRWVRWCKNHRVIAPVLFAGLTLSAALPLGQYFWGLLKPEPGVPATPYERMFDDFLSTTGVSKVQICTLDDITGEVMTEQDRLRLYLNCEVTKKPAPGSRSCCDHLAPADAKKFGFCGETGDTGFGEEWKKVLREKVKCRAGKLLS
jgi:hypothetical protein